MTTNGFVTMTLVDNNGASANAALPSVVALMGVSDSGTVGQIVSTRSASTLVSSFGVCPMTEFGAMLIAAGATVLAMSTTSNIGSGTGHGTSGAVQFTGTGTSVVTVAGFPKDTWYIRGKVVTSGTIGTAGIVVQFSADAGRTYGPLIALGTGTTYVIPYTGLTLSFAAGTLVAGDTFSFYTTEPVFATGDVSTAIAAFGSSLYAQTGWGSMALTGAIAGSQGTTLEGNLDSLALPQTSVFTRMYSNAVDATNPTGWGGAGQTDAAWQTALDTSWAGTSARRILAAAGFYNMPSAVGPLYNAITPGTNWVFGTPRYRRPLSWAIACRKVGLAPQQLSSWVKLGQLGNIVVDPINDPSDGFLYHDERINPGLDSQRFAAALSRPRQPVGYYVRSENLMSPVGSDFQLLAQGTVFDNFTTILFQVGTPLIDSITRTNANGTIYENDAQTIESQLFQAVANNMGSQCQLQNTTIIVDRTYNVQTNQKVRITGNVGLMGYIREIDMTLAVTNPLAAA